MRFSGLILLGLPTMALAQGLDPVFYADLRPTVMSRSKGPSAFHWWDRDGRASVVGVRMGLLNGNVAHVSQRLERVEDSGDNESLDEYSLERKGEWKLGKQYVVFGAGGLLRDSAPGLSVQTRLLVDQLPAVLSVADAGRGRTRGFFARVGNESGASVGVGEYIGNQSSSLTAVRHPESAPGRDRGYGLAWGLDTRRQVGTATLTAELVSLRQGATSLDEDALVSDVRAVWRTPKSPRVAEMRLLAGWSRDWQRKVDYLRLSAEISLDRRVAVTPYLRFEGLALTELGVSSRMRF